MQTVANRSALRLASPEALGSSAAVPLRILALGDSVVYGFGDPEGGGWVDRLRRYWMQPNSPGHALYNLGVRGDRLHQVAQRLDHEFRHRGELRHRVPDGIILSVGINDSARLGHRDGKNFTDFAEFQTHLAQLLDHAQPLGSIFFVGMTPVDESRMPFSNCLYYNHADQRRYNEATRIACLERHIPFVNILETWLDNGESWWRSRLCSDGLHPNSLGYETLLHTVMNWDELNQWADRDRSPRALTAS